MAEQTPNIGPMSEENAIALFNLWLFLDSIFMPIPIPPLKDDDGTSD